LKTVPLQEVLDLLQPDQDRIILGQERMRCVWNNEKPDALPVFAAAGVPEKKEYPRYPLCEQFEDKQKMLYHQLWGLIGRARARSDAQLAVRPNLGVGFIPSVFGLESIFVQEDQMPWVNGHLSKEEIRKFELPDVRTAGLVPRAVEYIQYFKETLAGRADVYLPDTQGPFDIAHLVRGHDIYVDMYDDPSFVHHLMDLCTRAYVAVTKVMKEAGGEPLDSGFHNTQFMSGGGVRLCDDSAINLSDAMYREFVQPYVERALAPFGGGWYHFCGDGSHILGSILDTKGVKGINFGNPEMYDFQHVMAQVLRRGKFYTGTIPQRNGESVQQFMDRIASYIGGRRSGLILHALPRDNSMESAEVLDLWYEKFSNGAA